MNFKAFLWFILCALRRKLLRAGGSETDGSTSLQPLSPLNHRHYWQKHPETSRNWFADFWTHLSNPCRHAHIWEQNGTDALAGHDAVRGKRPGKREAATPQGYCSAPLHSVKIWVLMVCYSPPDHAPSDVLQQEPCKSGPIPQGVCKSYCIILLEDRYWYRTIKAFERFIVNICSTNKSMRKLTARALQLLCSVTF